MTIYSGFSIAMLNYQRVDIHDTCPSHFPDLLDHIGHQPLSTRKLPAVSAVFAPESTESWSWNTRLFNIALV